MVTVWRGRGEQARGRPLCLAASSSLRLPAALGNSTAWEWGSTARRVNPGWRLQRPELVALEPVLFSKNKKKSAYVFLLSENGFLENHSS
jgi:hypothetical protein